MYEIIFVMLVSQTPISSFDNSCALTNECNWSQAITVKEESEVKAVLPDIPLARVMHTENVVLQGKSCIIALVASVQTPFG